MLAAGQAHQLGAEERGQWTRLLLAAGADPLLPDGSGSTPLDLIVRQHHAPALSAVLQHLAASPCTPAECPCSTPARFSADLGTRAGAQRDGALGLPGRLGGRQGMLDGLLTQAFASMATWMLGYMEGGLHLGLVEARDPLGGRPKADNAGDEHGSGAASGGGGHGASSSAILVGGVGGVTQSRRTWAQRELQHIAQVVDLLVAAGARLPQDKRLALLTAFQDRAPEQPIGQLLSLMVDRPSWTPASHAAYPSAFRRAAAALVLAAHRHSTQPAASVCSVTYAAACGASPGGMLDVCAQEGICLQKPTAGCADQACWDGRLGVLSWDEVRHVVSCMAYPISRWL